MCRQTVATFLERVRPYDGWPTARFVLRRGYVEGIDEFLEQKVKEKRHNVVAWQLQRRLVKLTVKGRSKKFY